MADPEWTCVAPTALVSLLDRAPVPLHEVSRTRLSVLYAVPSGETPWVGVAVPGSVRLPHALLLDSLPPAAPARIGNGALTVGDGAWRVARWWRSPAPRGLRVPAGLAGHLAGSLPGSLPDTLVADPALLDPLPREALPGPTYAGLEPHRLLGAGPGLTPAGDDVLAGALVAAHATADPRLPGWAAAVRALLPSPTRWYDGPPPSTTTAVSAAVLHDALAGRCTPELADFLVALCRGGGNVPDAHRALLGLGHSSGAALALGALHCLTTAHLDALGGAA